MRTSLLDKRSTIIHHQHVSSIEATSMNNRFSLSSSNVIVAIMMFVGFIMMLVRQPSKAGWMLLCMLAPALFHLAVCVYSFFVDVVRPCRLKLLKFEGVDRWLESHFRVSLYPRVYYSNLKSTLVIRSIHTFVCTFSYVRAFSGYRCDRLNYRFISLL